MDSQQLIDKLGYNGCSAFLQGKRLKEHHGYSFFFAQAEKKKHCNLKGVYTLLGSPDKLSSSSLTPVVYVCEADNETKAEEIHKRVWNQNIVPFLIVVTLKNIRLYSGFEYDSEKSDEKRVLAVAKNAKEVLDKLSALKSESIDSGDIWKQRPISVEGRVDRHLLANLKKLSEVLTDNNKDYKLPIEHAHTLIGKYIYLKYLRDRDILSDEQFEKAENNADYIFGNNANRDEVYRLETYLNGFLNGLVFPLPSINNIRPEHIKKVASTFKGGDPKSGQGALFDMYDFSYVPIETLSVVYQQFLHAKNKGRSKGAYYTPVHLVNFILDELDAKNPLKEGMKIFDPSCGSGAFLVQCYRRLIEGIIRGKGTKLNPTDLRKLLVDNIFGLDADKEACRVAELSLSLTLLDYIEPHDLRTYPTFQLPKLHNKNIFYCEDGFFDDKSLWIKSIPQKGYDWIVGNPPWKNIDKNKDKEPYHQKAVEWIDDNKKQCPVDNYQTAEAFAWRITKLLKEDGQCGLLMPAKTLTKKQGHIFRAKFFSEIETWCIVNFANIRRYLFENAINPAAAFFYSGKKNWDKSEHYITTYSPFAIEQSSQLNKKGRSKKIWSVFVNYAAIKDIPLRDIKDGSAVPWKAAMWGMQRDKCLLDNISRRYDDFLAFKDNSDLFMNQGPEFRSWPKKTDLETPEDFEAKLEKFKDNHEYLPEYVGKHVLDTEKIPTDCFQLPEAKYVCKILGKNDAYLRTRGGRAGLELFKAPHIVISASRSFSVYSDNDFMIPPRQIGIAGNEKLLKALALYLNSKFVTYQQWLTSASWGIERDNSNLDDLKKLPVPLSKLSDDDLTEWAKLHDEIVAADKSERESQQDRTTPLFKSRRRTSLPSLNTLLKQMNGKVYKLLDISKKQQWLIDDMLDVRMKLNDGKITKEAIKPASKKEIADFAHIFQEELDLFLDHTEKRKVHKVKVLYADNSAVIIVDHLVRSKATKPEVVKVQDSEIRQELDALQHRLTETRSQWIYFTRCLQIHEARRTYIFKPRQRLYWLKSQALAEADDFIAEKLSTE